MDALDLLAQSQQFYVNSGLGASRTIKYVHSDGTSIEELSVFANEVDKNNVDSDKSDAVATLSNVYLDQEPKQNDRVQFKNENLVWRVQSWKYLDSCYIIEITTKRYRV